MLETFVTSSDVANAVLNVYNVEVQGLIQIAREVVGVYGSESFGTLVVQRTSDHVIFEANYEVLNGHAYFAGGEAVIFSERAGQTRKAVTNTATAAETAPKTVYVIEDGTASREDYDYGDYTWEINGEHGFFLTFEAAEAAVLKLDAKQAAKYEEYVISQNEKNALALTRLEKYGEARKSLDEQGLQDVNLSIPPLYVEVRTRELYDRLTLPNLSRLGVLSLKN